MVGQYFLIPNPKEITPKSCVVVTNFLCQPPGKIWGIKIQFKNNRKAKEALNNLVDICHFRVHFLTP